MKTFFQKEFNRLVFIDRKATSQFWDELWNSDDFESIVKSTPNSHVSKETKKYLPKQSKVLEGGCGRGQHVFALSKNGYDVKGIDFAEETVDKLNKVLPGIIDLGDVRDLPYESDLFDGYWSLGVIEHFYGGYDEILQEAYRVIKPSGFFFLAFPSMSMLRRIKSSLGSYEVWDDKEDEFFYQFALDQDQVIEKLENLGFKILNTKGVDGLKGLKDELNFGSSLLSKIYNADSLFLKIVRALLMYPLTFFSNHSILIIAQK